MRKGIPEQYGIFYAMGGALSLEGVLSAFYHVCPTSVNFQFDTTFMYVMAVLVFLKVYQVRIHDFIYSSTIQFNANLHFQFRHPDITSNAHYVFAMIAVALVIEVIGYYTHSIFFWVLFVLAYLGIIIITTVQTYYNGMFR